MYVHIDNVRGGTQGEIIVPLYYLISYCLDFKNARFLGCKPFFWNSLKIYYLQVRVYTHFCHIYLKMHLKKGNT